MLAQAGQAYPVPALVAYHPLPGVGILGLAIHAGDVKGFHIHRFMFAMFPSQLYAVAPQLIYGVP